MNFMKKAAGRRQGCGELAQGREHRKGGTLRRSSRPKHVEQAAGAVAQNSEVKETADVLKTAAKGVKGKFKKMEPCRRGRRER